MKKVASVLIPFSGDGALLKTFFECFQNSHDLRQYELILIGDGCQNSQTIDYAKSLYLKKHIDHLILFDCPQGFGIANNEGVKRSSTNKLVFINDDILLMDHEIDKLLQEQINTHCAAIQPVLLYPQTDKIQSAGHVFGENFNRHAQQGRKKDKLILNSTVERQAITLSFCAIDKDVFNSLHGFNPFYYNAYEGLELTHRIHTQGLGCRVTGNVFAYHIQSSTRNMYTRSEEQYKPYFWIQNHLTIKEDLSNEWQITLPGNVQKCPFFCINFSPLKLMESVKRANFTIRENINIPLKGEINLLTAIPFRFISCPTPFLMICDSFSQLQKNMLWKKLRNHNDDLVLDTYGNSFLLSEIIN